MHLSCLDNYANDLYPLRCRRGRSSLCSCLPHSARRSKLPMLRRCCKTCQMLGDQLLGFSETPQFNSLVSSDRVRGVGDDYGQGMVTVVEVRQHLRDSLAIPGDELALRTAHLGITKGIPAVATQRLKTAQRAQERCEPWAKFQLPLQAHTAEQGGMEVVVDLLRLCKHTSEPGVPSLLQMQAGNLVFILVGHHFIELAHDRMRELDAPRTGSGFTRSDVKHEVDVGRGIGHILIVNE